MTAADRGAADRGAADRGAADGSGVVTAEALAMAVRRRTHLHDVCAAELVRLRAKGTAHDHWRIGSRGLVVRVPRTAGSAVPLERQAAAFARAGASGHVPALLAVLGPCDALPAGALIVAEITGRPPRLPRELPAIAEALAALHRLPLPAVADRPPVPAPDDPLRATAALVRAQARGLEAAGLSVAGLDRLTQELRWAEAQDGGAPPSALIGVDVHPGNFLIDRDGRAWFLDLERAEYGLPAFDLAHATLDTSTLFDPDVNRVLRDGEIAAFTRHWAAAVDAPMAAAALALFPTARRLVRLRTLAWMARWRAEGDAARGAGLDPTVRAHVRSVIARLLDGV